MYDNTKLDAAFAGWLRDNVKIGFGEHYSGDLLDDFESYLEANKLMKRGPGRVVFGKYLKNHGEFESRKRLGLTYWAGLKLLAPPKKDALEPRRYARTKAYEDERAEEVARLKAKAEFEASDEAYEGRLSGFKAELESETAERNREIGREDGEDM
jgi:hypothetical protein